MNDSTSRRSGLKEGWCDVVIVLRYRGNVCVVSLRILRRILDDRASCHQKDFVEYPKGHKRSLRAANECQRLWHLVVRIDMWDGLVIEETKRGVGVGRGW